MKFIFETVAEAQKTSLESAASFTEDFLIVVERLTKLNIDVTRSVIENSSEMTLFCLQGYLADEATFAWNALAESGVERYFGYCKAVREMAQEAARQLER